MSKETEDKALELFIKHVAEPFRTGLAKSEGLYVLRDATIKEHWGAARAQAKKVCGCTQVGPTEGAI